jgi:hypothetical protein
MSGMLIICCSSNDAWSGIFSHAFLWVNIWVLVSDSFHTDDLISLLITVVFPAEGDPIATIVTLADWGIVI